MPLRSRLYTINLPPTVAPEKVFEKVSEASRASQVEAVIREGKLYITIWGTEAQIKETWYRIRQALSELWELHSFRESGVISVEAVVREIRKTFPPEALAVALTLMGYRAEYRREDGVIETNAPLEKLLEAARRLAETIEELRFTVSGSAAKRVIASVAVGLSTDPQTVIEYGLRLGTLSKDEMGKIVLREEPSRATRKLVVVLRGRVAQSGGEAESDSEERQYN